MFKCFTTLLVLALVISSSVDRANCIISLSGASWVYRGTPQQNNTVLTFNLYDTLNLVCRASGTSIASQLVYAITKGSSPSGVTLSSTGTLTLANAGTIVYTDVDGIKAGFENFVIYASPFNYASTGTTIPNFPYDYRYISVGTLKTTDAGTYYCSVALIQGTTTAAAASSGAVTIVVNTKSGQAHSSRSCVNGFLTYSAVILGASKLLF